MFVYERYVKDQMPRFDFHLKRLRQQKGRAANRRQNVENTNIFVKTIHNFFLQILFQNGFFEQAKLP